MDNLIICPLQERRVNGTHGNQSFAGQTRRECHSMLQHKRNPGCQADPDHVRKQGLVTSLKETKATREEGEPGGKQAQTQQKRRKGRRGPLE